MERHVRLEETKLLPLLDLGLNKRMTMQLVAVLFLGACASLGYASSSPKVWRVDCTAGDQNTAQDAVAILHSLAELNSLTLQPGDQVLFRRGTVCHGTLVPRGSGSDSAPIRISSYGSGPRPRIEATEEDDAAVELRDQQHWEIDALDVSGSRLYGIRAVATKGLVQHLVLRNLTVHGVGTFTDKVKSKESGLVVVHATNPAAGFDDVLIDGVLAYDTALWAGILVSGSDGSQQTNRVVIRNSMVHDVQGDGIVLFRVTDGLIEHSVAWHTGMQETESIGTPNAIWTWACVRCIVQNNEAFLTDSPGVDGGAFDIDFWNKDNSVLNNYGHDTQGYCVSVFGAYSPTTIGSLVRGNLCIRNGLSPRLSQRQGAIFFSTWDGGSIDGVRIEENSIYFDPPGDYAVIQAGADLNARNIVFDQNVIDATSSRTVSADLKGAFESGRNAVTHKGFKVAEKQDLAGIAAPAWARSLAASGSRGAWKLVAAIPEITGDVIPSAAVGKLMLLRSQALQYGRNSLQITVLCRCPAEQRAALEADWRLGEDGIAVAELVTDVPYFAETALLNPDGQLSKRWGGVLEPVGLGLALRTALGIPRFAGMPAPRSLESPHVP